MSLQSESSNTAAAANLQDVADLLPLEWQRLDFDYVGDIAIELVFDPDDAEGQPYQIRVDLEIVDRADNLPQAQRDFAFWVSEVAANARYGEVR